MGDDIYNLDKGVSSIALVLPPSVETSATFIFAQFEQGEVSIGMAMAVVSVGLTTLCLLLLQHMEHKRKGVV